MKDGKKKAPISKKRISSLKKVYSKKKKDQKKALTYKASKADSVKNPENQPFVTEVAFNKGIPKDQVSQEAFNKRYGIKY